MSTGSEWVARMAVADAPQLAALRLVPGLEFGEMAGVIWLRGPALAEGLLLGLRRISGLELYRILPGGALRREGMRVPEGRLPPMRWQPLRNAFPVRLPLSSIAATRVENDVARVPVKLVRSANERPAGALLTDILTWLDWATKAPEIRLNALRFAAAQSGRVWIEGKPLPPIAGERYHLSEGVAAPAGYEWSPALDPKVLARWLSLAAGDTAFCDVEGRWEIIKTEQFIPATRAAARLTAAALHHE